MRIPGTQIPMNKHTVIPEPESHFSFSTKLMVMAIDLYEEEAPPEVSPFTTFALRKLRQFLDSRKEITAQSYRFFVEHAYNQFFQHEAFHQSATARTKARDIGAGELHTSTKLKGYIWIAGETKMTHVPQGQAGDVNMEDDEDDELDELPRLKVVVKPQEEQEEKGVSSLQREETQEDDVQAQDDDDVQRDIAPVRSSEDRHGQFLIRQLSPTHQRLLHEITPSSQNILTGDDLEGGRPLQRGDISYFSMHLMMEVLAYESFTNFMTIYRPSIGFEISYDSHHELKLALSKVIADNQDITSRNFDDMEEPDLVDDNPETPLPRPEGEQGGDPECKDSVENLSKENKHIILETDDDDLVECTLQWLRMCNKHVQEKIMDRVVKTEAKEEQGKDDVEVEEEQQEPPDPKVPAPTSSIECQTDESFLSGTKS